MCPEAEWARGGVEQKIARSIQALEGFERITDGDLSAQRSERKARSTDGHRSAEEIDEELTLARKEVEMLGLVKASVAIVTALGGETEELAVVKYGGGAIDHALKQKGHAEHQAQVA